MRLFNMVGYKLYKEKEDGSIHMIRIVDMHRPFKITSSTKEPSEITILDYDNNERKKVRVDSLKEYSPLKPDGVATFSIVTIRDDKGKPHKDVMITATKFLNIEYKLNVMPYAVCRQNINDIFYNLLSQKEDDTLVGLAVNQDTCPAGFDFGLMFAADSVEYNEFINFYRLDSLDDIYSLIHINKYNEVLKDSFEQYARNIKRPELLFLSEAGGWCKDLKTLISQNNFLADINQMLGITQVDFVLEEFLEERTAPEGIVYTVARDDLRYWLSSIYKLNIKEASVLEFDHDINLGDFNDAKYLLIKDSTGKLYLVVYLIEGEYYEADLEEKSKELDFSSKFKLSFINKYRDFQSKNIQ